MRGQDQFSDSREQGRAGAEENDASAAIAVQDDDRSFGRFKPISDQPLINRLHRFVVEIIFAGLTALLVYVSFVPFDFTRHPRSIPASKTVFGLSRFSSGLPDIFANIGIYIPVGALGFAVCRRRGLGRITSALLAITLVSLMSFAVERGQYWVASRVASWVDVTCNAIGAAVGVVMVALCEGQIRRAMDKARWAARRNWWMTLCKAAVCLVLLVNLRPYDVVVDVFHTAAGLRRANVSPLARWSALPAVVAQQVKAKRLHGGDALARAKWEYGIDRGVDVAVYAGVVALAVLGLAPSLRHRPRLYLAAGFIGVSLAGMVTVIRVFLISHGLDTAHFVCGLVGWPVGCVFAELVRRSIVKNRLAGNEPDAQEATVQPQTAERPFDLALWQKSAIGFALTVIVLCGLVPFDFGAGSGKICWLPFMAHFHSRPNVALLDLSGDFLRYAVAGVCLAMVVGHVSSRPWRRQLWITVVVACLMCAALEGVHMIMPTRQMDVTTLIMALIGGFAGAVGLRWVNDYHRSLPVFVVEDLLTSQLIEGETYKKLPELEPGSRQAAGVLPRPPSRSEEPPGG